MGLNYLLLIVAILISATAGYFSVAGLMSIFSGAMISIAIMGTVLEVGKISTTIWLHKNYGMCARWLRLYLSVAIIILMGITSMGIFGYLSRAHVQQSLGSDSINSKLSILENQIDTLKQDQDANSLTLHQLDQAINQVISLSNNQNGATKALTVRNGQKSERDRIQAAIQSDQQQINTLKEQEAPLKAELQKNEVDVGPIKFIAALIYGANPSQELLEKAVRWVIILLVVVFDPLALCMLIAADTSISAKPSEATIPSTEETPVESIAQEIPTVEPAIVHLVPVRKKRRAKKESAIVEEHTDNGQKLVGKMILPEMAPEGTLFISTETIPGKLYKFQSGKWVEADKQSNPGYISSSYVDFLKRHIDNGTIQVSQLTDDEASALSAMIEKAEG